MFACPSRPKLCTIISTNTPALAIARATRPDQAVVAAPIAQLPTRLAQAALPGPVLVMIGNVVGSRDQTSHADTTHIAAKR